MTYRGRYAYVDALGIDTGGEPDESTHLCRLTWLGSPGLWEWAFYSYASERYERSVGLTGSFVASPEEAFDCAAMVYLEGARFLIYRARTDHPDFPDSISVIGITGRDRVDDADARGPDVAVESQLHMHYLGRRPADHVPAAPVGLLAKASLANAPPFT